MAKRESKTTVVRFRCTPKEKALIEEGSKHDDRTVSDFCRIYSTRHAKSLVNYRESKRIANESMLLSSGEKAFRIKDGDSEAGRK